MINTIDNWKFVEKLHPAIQIGDLLSQNENAYQIISQIGVGGMGLVYKAKAISPQSKPEFIAIKFFINSSYWKDEKNVNECEQYWNLEASCIEIQGKSPLPHMDLLGKIKIESQNQPEYYLIFNYIEGSLLKDYFLSNYSDPQQFSLNDLCLLIQEIIHPLLLHLQFCHSKGIVHRDITISNILIGKDEEKSFPILIDWGTSKKVSINQIYTPKKPFFTNEVKTVTTINNVGTAPELRAGIEPVAASDIYMLGVLMYFLFTGELKKGLPVSIDDYILHPIQINPKIPSILNWIVEKMTQYEPSDRFAKLDDILMYLELFLLENEKGGSNELYSCNPIFFLCVDFSSKMNFEIIHQPEDITQLSTYIESQNFSDELIRELKVLITNPLTKFNYLLFVLSFKLIKMQENIEKQTGLILYAITGHSHKILHFPFIFDISFEKSIIYFIRTCKAFRKQLANQSDFDYRDYESSIEAILDSYNRFKSLGKTPQIYMEFMVNGAHTPIKSNYNIIKGFLKIQNEIESIDIHLLYLNPDSLIREFQILKEKYHIKVDYENSTTGIWKTLIPD